MAFMLGPRRGETVGVTGTVSPAPLALANDERQRFEELDLLYRSLCAILYNYVPMSGHPGGSISSGRIVAGLLFGAMDYDLSRPERPDADVLSYAAGHKAMGLYAMWALRDEVARLGAPELLPDLDARLRLEDLLGFRRNPTTPTGLFRRVRAKALDGHPTPATPFVPLATGASGVGLGSSIGYALALRDWFGRDAPRVHVLEGEGGLTPGRAAEALAAAGTARLDNVFVHLDWNQASIDSERVCRDGDVPGDYVQWDPCELFQLHDWNVVFVPDGMDLPQVLAAQRAALRMSTGQPTAIVYRTVKGWRYGIEGRASHGGGHKLCSPGFYEALGPFTAGGARELPSCEGGERPCASPCNGREVLEQCFWEALRLVRLRLEGTPELTTEMARRLLVARERLDGRGRRPREDRPRVQAVYDVAARSRDVPPELALAPGTVTTLRGELGRALQHLNRTSGGALFIAAADLLSSTSVGTAGAGFAEGYWNAASNPGSRLLAIGGICEDGIAGVLSGVSSFGAHIGVGSSYGAFIAPLGHVAARLHGIGQQARRAATGGEPYRTMVLVCAHAGLKTGEDGPTHADPQALQLLQGNFPPGVAVTLTPWEPQEVWPLLMAALRRRPALIAPFVTRPSETVLDRRAFGLAPAEDAVTGLYLLRRPGRAGDGTIVLQESAVTYAFVTECLPLLDRDGISPWIYSVASAELFDALPLAEQRRIFPEERAREAMGITGFTLPTLDRWLLSAAGRAASLHPYAKGHFLGSGQGETVLAEAGLDGLSQYRAVRAYVEARRTVAA